MPSPSNPYVLHRGYVNSLSGGLNSQPAQSLPSHFGTVNAQGPWTEEQQFAPGPLAQDMRPINNVSPQTAPASRRPPTSHVSRETMGAEWRSTSGPSVDDVRIEQNRKRAAGKHFQKPYLKEMAAAHAHNREPIIEIPVCDSGTVIGLKSLGMGLLAFVPIKLLISKLGHIRQNTRFGCLKWNA